MEHKIKETYDAWETFINLQLTEISFYFCAFYWSIEFYWSIQFKLFPVVLYAQMPAYMYHFGNLMCARVCTTADVISTMEEDESALEPSNSASAADKESSEELKLQRKKERLRQRIETLRVKENYEDEVWQTFFCASFWTINLR